ncbi:hypothetical protein LTR95_004563 [Oleoguttula sp. CCFEE 5521]
MANGKRKGTASNPNKPATKRRKTTHAHGKIDPNKFYAIKDIVDESANHYLVSWEDDSDTGQSYEPTWEPHANATAQAVADWKAKKVAKQRHPIPTDDTAPSEASTSKRKRPRKVIESSPSKEICESQDALPTVRDAEDSLFVSQSPSEDHDNEPQPSSSVASDQVVSELASAADKLVTVRPSDPPSSYQDLTFSSSQVFTGTAPVRGSTPEPSQYQPDPVDASKSTDLATEVSAVATTQSQQQQTQSIPVNFGETEVSGVRIVPDSQSLPDSSAFRPSTSEGETQSTGGAEVEDRVAETSQPRLEASQSAVPPVQSGATRIERSSEQLQPNEQDASRVERPLASAQATTSSSELRLLEVSAEPIAQSHETQVSQPPASPKLSLAGQSQGGQPTAVTITSGSAQSSPDLEVSSLVTRAPPVQLSRESTQPAPSDSSSFPFHTQVAPVLRPAIDIVSSRPTTETQSSRYDPFDLDVEPSIEEPSIEAPERLLSSHLSVSAFPSLPVQSVQIGESAPALPQIPSTPTRPSSSALQSSASATMESATPGESLAGTLQELKELRARGRARREAAGAKARQSSAVTTPAKPSAVPAYIAVEVAAATPPTRLTTPAPRGARSPSAVPAVTPLEAPTRDDMNTSERYATLVPGSEETNGMMLRRQSTVAGTTSLKPQDSCHVVPIALVGHQRDAYPSLIRREETLIKRFLAERQPDDSLVAEIEALLKRLRAITIHPDLDNLDTFTQYDVPAATSAQWDVDSSAKFRFLRSLVDALRDSSTMLVVLASSDRLLKMLQTFFTGMHVSWESSISFGAALRQGLDVYVLDSRNDDFDWHSIVPDVTLVIDGNIQDDKPAMRRSIPESRLGGQTPMICSLVVPGTIEHVESCLSPHLTRQQKLRATVNGLHELLYDAGRLEPGQLSVADTAKALAGFVLDKQPDREWPLTSITMLENLDSQTDSELDGVEVGHKHGLTNGDLPPFKRTRTEESNGVLPSTINPMDIDMTHVSDSVARPSASLSATESRLQTLLHTTQTRLAEHERALSELQYSHEEQRIRLFDAERERDAANSTAARAVTRLTDQNAQIQVLRTERSDMQVQLVTAAEALTTHSVPERAELEVLRQQVLKAENETARLTRRLDAQTGDLAYFQSQYQSASNTAQTLANEVSELSAQLTALKLLASGEQGRAREQTLSAQSAALRKENLQMKARLAQLEAGTTFRDEELARLKEAGRGRMGTRGNSVPRSPRMGGSRQGSPAVSELGRRAFGRD